MYDLTRFTQAQERVYKEVLKELKEGEKRSHWMWFIFPQFKGLGRSFMAREYAIKSTEEAEAYLAHDILGQRLVECCELLLKIDHKSIREIMRYPDNLKLHSSMTLFYVVSNEPIFQKVLNKYFDGKEDCHTVELLEFK